MDPQTDLPDLVEDLEVDIDDLSTALEPLLATPLHTTASSLPLLDKAKLYCLAAYAIESLLFASLTASGVNATEHAVFKEIARLRQYNTKIKEIEDRGIKGSAEGRARLDVAAAGRFIKHGLAGNDKYDLERQERQAKERARAHLKAQQINKKFDDEGKEVKGETLTPKKRGADEVEAQEDYSEEEVLEGMEETAPATKKARVDATESMDLDSEAASSSQASTKKSKKESQSKKAKSKSKPANKAKQNASSTEDDDATELSIAAGSSPPETSTPQPKKRGRPSRKDKKTAAKAKQQQDTETTDAAEQDAATPSTAEVRVTRKRNSRLSTTAQNIDGEEGEEEAMVPTPDRAPKTRSETFNALLDGSMGEKQALRKGKGAGGNGRGGKKAGGKGKGK